MIGNLEEVMAELETQLTKEEKHYLEMARGHPRERYSLENYAYLWRAVDERLGRKNRITKAFLDEYWRRDDYEPPINKFEHDGVQMMRASFYFPRTNMPKEVVAALMVFDIFERK